MSQQPNRNYGYDILLSCTFCAFKTQVKKSFQRHLMSSHGIKLRGLEDDSPKMQRDYGLRENVTPDTCRDMTVEGQEYICDICNKSFSDRITSVTHRRACKKYFQNPPRTGKSPSLQCPNCQLPFFVKKALIKHQKFCGKECMIHCVFCTFRSITFTKVRKHLLDTHNLIGKMTKYKEVDFEQAVNNAPYTLHRPIEYDTLPTFKDIQTAQAPLKHFRYSHKKLASASGTPQNKKFSCSKCNKKFLKGTYLRSHQRVCQKNTYPKRAYT